MKAKPKYQVWEWNLKFYPHPCITIGEHLILKDANKLLKKFPHWKFRMILEET